MDKVRKSLSVLPWCQSFWTAMVPPPCSSEVAVWLLWENRCVQSRLRQTNAMGLKLCWLINTECIWLRCDHHFSSVCRFDLNSVKPNSHCVPNMRLWVSQNQSTTLHTKITILYKAKSGGWNSLNCIHPSQLQKIVHPTSILRIVVIEELCNLSENFLPLVIQIACQASRETWPRWGLSWGVWSQQENCEMKSCLGACFASKLIWTNEDKILFTSFLASVQSVSKLSIARHPGHTSKGSWQSSLSLTKPLIKRNTSAGESSYRRSKALLAESTKCCGKP